MHLIRRALIGTTALFLAVSTHAAEGDSCGGTSDCLPTCCDADTRQCGARPSRSVGNGNVAARACECAFGHTYDASSGVCGTCSASTECDGDACCEEPLGRCSIFDEGSRSNGEPATAVCECAPGALFNFVTEVCGVAPACDPSDTICDDPHMQGLRGQHIDWSGIDGGWYSLVKDELADLDVSVRLTAPLPDEFPDRQLVTGLGIMSEGHSLAIEVTNPYSIDTVGCGGASPCLANGGLSVFVDGEEVDGLLRFSREEYVADGIKVSASNLPVECRQFGGDKIWARMYEEMLQGTRTLVDETIEDWILKSRSMAAPEWCAKYLADNDLADLQSTHAIFKIETATVTVRLNIGVNHQGGGELDWDGRVLPDLEFWQMDVGLDGLNVDNPSLSGILGETARPVIDENGDEVMEGFEAFRGTVEDYRVSGALGTHFALLDKLEESHE